ncbi:VOC family protein [Paenibacillus mesophilus]|uniref:VOC family protein n=1 Tax=Paenibacillus mesophilus TaxID=2582849 RepID=UPI00110E4734|nr:VOC family protein [Paenibacillus mesophilus]TMV48782.1 VOC family protein [Paenibacillus mesophilus]
MFHSEIDNSIIQEVNFIHLPVSNVDEAVNWYVKHLGCKGAHKVHDGLASVNLPSGPTLLFIQTQHEERAKFLNRGRDYSIAGFITKDIEKAFASLKENGVRVLNYRDEGDVGKFFDFYDLDGNMFTIWGCPIDDYNSSLNKSGEAL